MAGADSGRAQDGVTRLTRNERIIGRCTSRSTGAKKAGRVLHPLQGVAVAVPQDP
jgi:hypothetical protein